MKRSLAAVAILLAACSNSSSSSSESDPAGESQGALEIRGLEAGEYAMCEPVDVSDSVVEHEGETFRVTKFTIKRNSDDDVILKVDRKKVRGNATLDPIKEITPQFVHTARTLRASIKRDISLRAAKSSRSDSYIGTVTVHRKSFAVECVMESASPPACREGQSRPDADGCNTCTCNGSNWACTELFCPQPVRPRPQGCQDGDTQSLDGCNTCTCNGGNWACTELFCGNR